MSEVARLADTLVILDEGRVSAAGPAAELMSRIDVASQEGDEASALVAVEIVRHDPDLGLTIVSGRAGEMRVPLLRAKNAARTRLRIYARDVILAAQAPGLLSAMNVLPGTVSAIETLPDAGILVQVDCSGVLLLSRITRGSLQALGLHVGSPVHAIIKAAALADRTAA
jgi:molybdate transport system ATP-binding protein